MAPKESVDKPVSLCYTERHWMEGHQSPLGGMAERFIAAVLKTVDRKIRGFESLSLRLLPSTPVRTGIVVAGYRGSWLEQVSCALGRGWASNMGFLSGEVPEWSIGTAC
jgi:hypothetical protein